MKKLTLLIISVFLLSLFTVVAAPQPGLCYFGDSNGDCIITRTDADQAKLSSNLKTADYSGVTPSSSDVQDVNGDGIVSISDYNLIKGMISLKTSDLTGIPTAITATSVPTTLDWNAASTITVKVTDVDGTPRAGIGVSFTIDKDLSTADATLTGRDPSNGDNPKTTSLPYINNDSVFELTNTISQGGEATININTNSLVNGQIVIKTFIQGNPAKGGSDINGNNIIINVVNGAVTIINIAPTEPTFTMVSGSTTSYTNQLIKFTVSSTDTDLLVYTMTGKPAGATFVGQTFEWTPTQADKTGSMTYYNMLFKATDINGASSEKGINIILVNSIPVIQEIANITINENGLVSVTPVATDDDNDTLTYTYSSLLNSAGNWQTDYNSAGVFTITVTATDGINGAQKTFNINVNDITQNNDNQGGNPGDSGGGHNYVNNENITLPAVPIVEPTVPAQPTVNTEEQNVNAQNQGNENQVTGFSVLNLVKQNPITTAIVSVIILGLLSYGIYFFRK